MQAFIIIQYFQLLFTTHNSYTFFHSCLRDSSERITWYVYIHDPRSGRNTTGIYIYIYIYIYIFYLLNLFFCGTSTRSRIMDFSLGSFAITLSGHNTFGTTPVVKSSAQRRDLYLTPQNIQKRSTSTPPAGFEPPIPASQRLQTHALDCATTGISHVYLAENIQYMKWWIGFILFIICFKDGIFLNTVLTLSSPQNIGFISMQLINYKGKFTFVINQTRRHKDVTGVEVRLHAFFVFLIDVGKFYVHVNVHRHKCLITEPTRCTNFSNLFLD